MKTPLLLLHGALGSAAQFDGLRRLLPADRPVLAPDFPGHGGAAADQPFSIAHFADHIIALLDDRSIHQVPVFGYSMGGYVALYLAWKYPERIERVFTLGTKLEWTPDVAARETARLDPEKIAAKVPAFAELLAARHTPADWQTVVRQTAQLLNALGNGSAIGPDAFEKIHCPVCIGLGAEDNMVTPEESQAVAAQIPFGVFEFLPGVKHPFEQVDLPLLSQRLKVFFQE